MGEIEKSVLGSVRLDSDVWEAVRAMKASLNQYLRSNLLGEMRLAGAKGTIAVEEKAGKVSATVNLVSDLDAVSENRGKASTETWRRGPRQKGDKGR